MRSTRRHRKSAQRGALMMATLGALALAAAPAASATATYTLSGSGNNGLPFSPDSNTRDATVDATRTGTVVGGTLETAGREESPGLFDLFSGSVTCMKVELKGKRVVVGAFGRVHLEGQPDLPGKYAQILTVEFGSFENPVQEKFSSRFAILGGSGQGERSLTPPSCSKASFKQTSGWGGFELRKTAG